MCWIQLEEREMHPCQELQEDIQEEKEHSRLPGL